MTARDEGAGAESPLDIVPSFAVLRGNLGGSLLVNGAAPFIAYQVISARGVAPVPALALTSVFPIAGLLVGFARNRRADAIGVVSLGLIALATLDSVHFAPRLHLVLASLGTS